MLGEFFFDQLAVSIEFAFMSMFRVCIDGLEPSVAISLETGLYGFTIAVEEHGNSGGIFSFVMESESVHAYHDVWLGMVEPVAMNGRKVVGRNRNA